MLTHSRAAIRKRAVLVLYKMITKQPDVLQASFGRLRDKLEDPDPGMCSPNLPAYDINTP